MGDVLPAKPMVIDLASTSPVGSDANKNDIQAGGTVGLPDIDALLASINVESASLPSESIADNPTGLASAGLSDEIKALFASLPTIPDLATGAPTPAFDFTGSSAPPPVAPLFDFSQLASLNPLVPSIPSKTMPSGSNGTGGIEDFDLDSLLASFETQPQR